MHTVAESGASVVPAFLTKLWTLVEDTSCNDLICWDPNGKSFHVYDQSRFAKEVLPLYFKHSNIASFIRQLNMYGFRKVMSMGHGALKIEADEMEFQHQFFQRDHEELLEFIKRKQVSSGTKADEVKIKHEDVNKVLLDVKTMKGKHDNVNTKLEHMKRENEALWREVASLRQQHKKHEQIVGKLIQFLVTMVNRGNHRGLMKRGMPLMLSDAPEVPTKVPKYSKQISFDPSEFKLLPSTEASEVPGSGPVIHDITEEPLQPAAGCSHPVVTTSPIVNSPPTMLNTVVSPSGDSLLDPSDNLIIEEVDPLQIPAPSAQIPSTLLEDDSPSDDESDESKALTLSQSLTSPLPSKLELSEQLDNVQFDIDSLKDLLHTGHYNLDSTMLQGLQSLIDGDEGKTSSNSGSIVGNELIQYNPQLTPQDEFMNLLDYSNLMTDDPLAPQVSSYSQLNTPQPAFLQEPFGDLNDDPPEEVD